MKIAIELGAGVGSWIGKEKWLPAQWKRRVNGIAIPKKYNSRIANLAKQDLLRKSTLSPLLTSLGDFTFRDF